MTEFDLIQTYFSDLGTRRDDVVVGVGDDCALLRVPSGQGLAVSIDTLVSGVHFLPECDPESVGYKSLAVGLSDLAAMGAKPLWATLALTLPPELVSGNHGWIEGFSRGFNNLARAHGVSLVGGDTTRGPLSVTVQVHGIVPDGKGILRRGAAPGDLICVSGTLGDAGLALAQITAGHEPAPRLRARLEQPMPRVELGQALKGLATAMIDVSDGLVADLGHILQASQVRAELALDALPLSPAVEDVVQRSGDWGLPLTSGDDYELCFCVPAKRVSEVPVLAERLECPLTVIGFVSAGTGLICRDDQGAALNLERGGFDHFIAQSG